MEAADPAVLGHYSCCNAPGAAPQPLLEQSSLLFRAIVQDDLGALSSHAALLQDAGRQLHSVLHWQQAGTRKSSAASSPASTRSQDGEEAVGASHPVAVIKQRTLIGLAALHGSVKVLKFLLSVKGADPHQAFPDGHTAFSLAELGAAPVEVTSLLAEAAPRSQLPPATPPGSGPLPPLTTATLAHTGSNSVAASPLAGTTGGATLAAVLATARNGISPASTPLLGGMSAPTAHGLFVRACSSVTDASGPIYPVLPPSSATAAAASGTTSGEPAPSLSAQSSLLVANASCTSAAAAAPLSFSVELHNQLSLQSTQELGSDLDASGAFNPNEGLPYSSSELTLPEYSTNEFRMFAFKVVRCSKRFAHDWRACPFSHPTENARRRDPREFRYCALACPDYKQGFCVRGDLCPYAHGVFEAWLHPSRYRTQLCKDGATCHRPICFFAHSLPELRTPTHTWTPTTAQDNDHAAANAANAAKPAPPGAVATLFAGPAAARAGALTAPTTAAAGPAQLAALLPGKPSAAGGLPALIAAAALPQRIPAAKPSLDPSAMAAALSSSPSLLGLTAPRMSNAFARKHGLNPKDNAMLNLHKIALQAPPGSSAGEQLGRLLLAQQQQQQQPTHAEATLHVPAWPPSAAGAGAYLAAVPATFAHAADASAVAAASAAAAIYGVAPVVGGAAGTALPVAAAGLYANGAGASFSPPPPAAYGATSLLLPAAAAPVHFAPHAAVNGGGGGGGGTVLAAHRIPAFLAQQQAAATMARPELPIAALHHHPPHLGGVVAAPATTAAATAAYAAAVSQVMGGQPVAVLGDGVGGGGVAAGLLHAPPAPDAVSLALVAAALAGGGAR